VGALATTRMGAQSSPTLLEVQQIGCLIGLVGLIDH